MPSTGHRNVPPRDRQHRIGERRSRVPVFVHPVLVIIRDRVHSAGHPGRAGRRGHRRRHRAGRVGSARPRPGHHAGTGRGTRRLGHGPGRLTRRHGRGAAAGRDRARAGSPRPGGARVTRVLIVDDHPVAGARIRGSGRPGGRELDKSGRTTGSSRNLVGDMFQHVLTRAISSSMTAGKTAASSDPAGWRPVSKARRVSRFLLASGRILARVPGLGQEPRSPSPVQPGVGEMAPEPVRVHVQAALATAVGDHLVDAAGVHRVVHPEPQLRPPRQCMS